MDAICQIHQSRKCQNRSRVCPVGSGQAKVPKRVQIFQGPSKPKCHPPLPRSSLHCWQCCCIITSPDNLRTFFPQRIGAVSAFIITSKKRNFESSSRGSLAFFFRFFARFCRPVDLTLPTHLKCLQRLSCKLRRQTWARCGCGGRQRDTDTVRRCWSTFHTFGTLGTPVVAGLAFLGHFVY